MANPPGENLPHFIKNVRLIMRGYIEEAVKNASVKEYEGTKTKVLNIEYLLAIMVDTNRPKDRERIRKLLDEVYFDRNALISILDRHSLRERWEKQIEKR